MKGLFSLVNRSVLVAVSALALGACSRGEYAMLPKSPAYLGSKSATVAARPAAQPVATPAAEAAPAAAPVVAAAPAAPVAEMPARSTAPVAKVAPAKATPAPVAAPAPEVAVPAAMAEVAPAAPKLNLVQRLALKKISKKLDKIVASSPQLKKHDATASTQAMDSKLRQILLIGGIGLIVEILGIALSSWIVYLIGGIVLVVALVMLLLYLLDK